MDDLVTEALVAAQVQGFIGPGPIKPHLDHAHGFVGALTAARGVPLGAEDRVLDLGSGGGLPGLVVVAGWPGPSYVLLEGSTRRAAHLRSALGRLGDRGEARVDAHRAEVAGRAEGLRGRFSVVLARAFGAPAVTAECASPFLGVGGHLVVSERPDVTDGSRWPEGGLALLGLEQIGRWGSFVVLCQRRPCPDRFPRRVGMPGKHPLF